MVFGDAFVFFGPALNQFFSGGTSGLTVFPRRSPGAIGGIVIIGKTLFAFSGKISAG
jgi:hypothetical protein